MRGSMLAGCVATLLLALSSREVFACSYALPAPAEPDPAMVGVDVTPPVLSMVWVAWLERGIPAEGSCGTRSTFSLGGIASDDLTPAEELAWRVESLRGSAPIPYDGPMTYMTFIWEEQPTESLDLELRVRAVDKAGNESEPVDIRVTDRVDADGQDDSDDSDDSGAGCRLAPASSHMSAAWLPVLAALSWCLRRRR